METPASSNLVDLLKNKDSKEEMPEGWDLVGSTSQKTRTPSCCNMRRVLNTSIRPQLIA